MFDLARRFKTYSTKQNQESQKLRSQLVGLFLSYKANFSWCVGKDSNLRSPKATDLQSVVIDHSTTDAPI